MKNKTLKLLLALTASPIALLASHANDRKIEDAAKASYNFHAVLDDSVKAKSSDGVVTLTGTVQDKDARELAENTVEILPGVSSVKNEIKIESTYPDHSDRWIAVRIRGRLLVKSNVSAAKTKVEVANGNVTLIGTAENIAEKELTGIYAAEIDGVKSVKNELVINTTPSKSQTASETMDDASITTQVKYALLSHKATSAIKTKVTTSEGDIVISGVAKSDAEKSLVTKLAQDVRGAKSVANKMTVKI